MLKKVLSVVASMVFACSLVPAAAFAADSTASVRIAQVSVGGRSSGAIDSNGGLWVWGRNNYGQLGDGTRTDRGKPVKIMDNVVSAAIGYAHSAAVKKDGTLWIWGSNDDGRLGDGTMSDHLSPVQVLTGAKSVSVGMWYTAAVKQDGSLWTWGDNNNGQLGDGTTSDRSIPKQVLSGVASVSLGSTHSAAVTTGGDLYTWGSGSAGQLGTGSTDDVLTPKKIMSGIASVSLGIGYSAAVAKDGTLYTWGSASSGRLGTNATGYIASPKAVLTGVKQVAVGTGSHGMALKKDGTLWVWGANDEGQLGIGSVTSSSTPVQVANIGTSEVTSIGVGTYHSAIACADGTCRTWGANASGQLGLGTIASKLYPAEVAFVEGAPSYNLHVDVSVGSLTYAVAMGQLLTIDIKVETGEPYEEGVHKYKGYLAYFSQGQWHQVESWNIDGGTTANRVKLNVQAWEYMGDVTFVASVFPVDNFSEGNSLADRLFTVTMLPASFTVTLDANGGACEAQSMQATYALAYGGLPQPERTGYVFDGWYTMKSGGDKVDSATVVTAQADHTLYAHWVTEPKKDIANATVDDIDDYVYDGSAKRPQPQVRYGATVLVAGTDYTYGYASNTNAGTATVTVTGIGAYAGTVSKTFAITKAKPSMSFASSGLSAQAGSVVERNALSYSGDASVRYASSNTAVATVDAATGIVTPVGAGQTVITATASGGRNYADAFATYTLTVSKAAADESASSSSGQRAGSAAAGSSAGGSSAAQADEGVQKGTDAPEKAAKKTSIAKAKVKLSATKFYYNGKAKKPAVTVKLGKKTLLKKARKGNGKVKVTYSKGRKKVGTYTVTVKGTGKYKGVVKKTFTVNPAKTKVRKLKAYVPDSKDMGSGTGALEVRWKKSSTADNYDLLFSLSANFKKGVKEQHIPARSASGKKLSLRGAGLMKKKTYYVKVRASKTVGVTVYRTPWSKAKKITTK